MADFCISARGLTLAFEPHPPVFAALDLHLTSEPVALIGPNGAGKTLLAECLAGVRKPQEGSLERRVPVAFLPQQAAEQEDHQSVAAFLGVDAALNALRRLLSGKGQVDDLSILEERWTLQEDLEAELAEFQLGVDLLDAPVSALSGGQRTRLHLLKLARLPSSYLILDEPTNHLDQAGRDWLANWISQRSGGTLVITHDQALLATFTHLLELRAGQLQPYRLGFADYQEARKQLLEKARQTKSQARLTLKKERQQLQTERERHEQRAAKGRAKARKGDMPKVLLDARKERSEATGGRIAQKHQAAINQEQQRLQQAEALLGHERPLAFPLTEPEPVSGCLLALNEVLLPRITAPRPLNWQIKSGERWWLQGANGRGKSTLLAVISGLLEPLSGEVQRRGSLRLLDQKLSLLNGEETALANFQHLNPGWTQADYRDRLAWLRLRGDQALQPASDLSGGERLKVALACCLMGPESAQLILLDEPDNHLDLESQSLLAQVLAEFKGSLLLVSHSAPFAQAVGFERQLVLQ